MTGVQTCALPICALTPRWRGVTALHELKAAGVDTMIASDNTRDPFYAYGDLDMLEVWREGIRVLHLDHPVAPWALSLFTAPAKAMSIKGYGALKVGAAADMILTRARSFTELFSRPQADRTVLREGRPIAARAPDYARLDALTELRPSL